MILLVAHSLWIFGLLYLLIQIFQPKIKVTYGLLGIAISGLLVTCFTSHVSDVQPLKEMIVNNNQGGHGTGLLFWLYLFGVVIQVIRHGQAFKRTNLWRTQGEIVEQGYYQEVLQSMLNKMRITKRVNFKLSQKIVVPMVVGVIRPVILFPVCLVNQLEENEVEAILAHELQHIVNKDYLWNLVLALLEVVLFFNPFVYLIHRYIVLEREVACDQAAAKWIGNPLLMAKCLLNLEGKIQEPNMAMSLHGKGLLKQRINRLVGKGNDVQVSHSFFSIVASLAVIMMSFAAMDEKMASSYIVEDGIYYYNDTITLPGYVGKISSLEFKHVQGEVKDVYINDEKIENIKELDLSEVSQPDGNQTTETNKFDDYENGLLRKYKAQNPQKIAFHSKKKNQIEIIPHKETSVDLSSIEGYQYGKSRAKNSELSELPILSSEIKLESNSNKDPISFFFDHTHILGNHKDSKLEPQGTHLLWYSLLAEEYKDLSVEEGIVEILSRAKIITTENFVLVVRPEFILLDKNLLPMNVVKDVQNYIIGKNRILKGNDQYQYIIVKNKIM